MRMFWIPVAAAGAAALGAAALLSAAGRDPEPARTLGPGVVVRADPSVSVSTLPGSASPSGIVLVTPEAEVVADDHGGLRDRSKDDSDVRKSSESDDSGSNSSGSNSSGSNDSGSDSSDDHSGKGSGHG